MNLTTGIWNWLEIAKLVVGVLTPLSVVLFGWFVSRRLKRLELVQWSNQKLIEKRLVVYDSIAPLLNKLLCFYTWVGYWKDVSPNDVMKTKRDLDQIINIYRHVFDEDVYTAYQAYIQVLFETFTGVGRDAKIRSLIHGSDGNRIEDCTFTWDPAWTERFSVGNAAPKKEVRDHYYRLMNALRGSLGVRE